MRKNVTDKVGSLLFRFIHQYHHRSLSASSSPFLSSTPSFNFHFSSMASKPADSSYPVSIANINPKVCAFLSSLCCL